MDGAAAARAFAIARRTMVEALVGIVYQRTAAGAELLVAFIMQTVEPYHELYCLFLLGYLVQWSLLEIFAEVGKSHVALLPQRVVHGEGG